MLTRRELLVMTAATAVAAACSGDDDSADRPSTTTTTKAGSADSCVLSPELTAGPYHLDDQLVRRDITEGRPGTPLELQVKVLALPGCKPLTGAAVDVWHCDANGEYSGWNGNTLAETQAQGRNDKRYLRGIQRTGQDGVATFATIVPGWYEGRAVHIHLRVVNDDHVTHVGQAFFDEALIADVLSGDPYRSHTGTRTTNEQDSIYADAGPGAITRMTRRGKGYVGSFTCMVDPAATPSPA